MKKITFPAPEHEQAIAIVENARKELEALGFDVSYRTKINGDALCQNEITGYFNINFDASKTLD